MNRLLITQTGEQLRNEMKQQAYQQRSGKQVKKKEQRLPELVRQPTNLLIDTERDHILYQKTLSEVALSNLNRVASLSLLGQKSKNKLETHIREELNLPNNFQYLNQSLDKQLNKILSDKDLKTKRKRHLLTELKRIEKKRTTSHNEDFSIFSSCIEDYDKNQKMTAIINAEGKLAQLTRRYKQKELNDQKLKLNLNISLEKMQERKNMRIEAINPLSPTQIKINSQRQFNEMFYDNSEERFHNRLQEKHVKQICQIWSQYQFPKQTKRWIQFIQNAQQKKKQ
ncbi:unnamed protein product [Paramecium pentaurelia]|uniref:Uncharacterized protein n=1 Tax=Paramecium pentaurelia TaxID=43138 RepID=A0A8S1WF75_9CILI|nr:unnamed protein product [Paramecium pentaurelia]